MTDTLISLISIFIGVIAANVFGIFSKKQYFDIVGNSMAGVFGSIFFIKALGRLGISPTDIMKTGTVNNVLLIVNLLVSIFGAIIILVSLKKINIKLNKKKLSNKSS